MSFRREVFAYERFDEALSGYAYKEDIDFSYRVSRRYTLVQTPKAKCDHLRSGVARMPSHHLQRMNVANQFYLHRKLMPQTAANRAALWWALLGLFVLNAGKALQTRDPGLVTGLIAGAFEQAGGRGLVDPAAEIVPSHSWIRHSGGAGGGTPCPGGDASATGTAPPQGPPGIPS
jgi:GT2 family glycosyltransferase